jgi:rhamnopyranosyl-N-acetylglucosaminyl-diphospho-decaprenol beta-1,3/1,4-galactofuranosyltransferase
MRVLAHIHTMNDAAVIEQLLEGLCRQTRPPDGIVVVDNASTDTTLERTFPDRVAIIRNLRNLGTSGAVRIGLAYALEHQFDWTWVFDADSVPEPRALENLLTFFDSLPPADQERVCFLACRLENADGEVRHHPMTFTDSAVAPAEAEGSYTKCDYFLWTGSLFRMPAVAKIGLPSADYVLDVAEVEYGYRARQLEFASYVVNSAVTHQDVGRAPGAVITRTLNIGRFKLAFREISAIRTYYACRNLLYFWLYQCRPLRPQGIMHSILNVLLFPTNFLLEPVSHHRQLTAYFRGVWDGLTGHIERRY